VGVAEESGVGYVVVVGGGGGAADGAAGVVPGVAVPAGLVGGEDPAHDEVEPVVVAVPVVAVDEGVGVAECAHVVVPAVDDAQGHAQVGEEPRRGVAAAEPGVEAALVSEDYVDDARDKAREWEEVA